LTQDRASCGAPFGQLGATSRLPPDSAPSREVVGGHRGAGSARDLLEASLCVQGLALGRESFRQCQRCDWLSITQRHRLEPRRIVEATLLGVNLAQGRDASVGSSPASSQQLAPSRFPLRVCEPPASVNQLLSARTARAHTLECRVGCFAARSSATSPECLDGWGPTEEQSRTLRAPARPRRRRGGGLFAHEPAPHSHCARRPVSSESAREIARAITAHEG
jgi:hypothetical protein